MSKLKVIIAAVLFLFSPVMAADLSITGITPVFDPATPGFGEFSIKIGVKNGEQKSTQVSMACLYVGLTKPGVLFKDEPSIQKQYMVVKLEPLEMKEIVLPTRFAAYHPETKGELIVSLVGADVIKSMLLRTAFHPKSED